MSPPPPTHTHTHTHTPVGLGEVNLGKMSVFSINNTDVLEVILIYQKHQFFSNSKLKFRLSVLCENLTGVGARDATASKNLESWDVISPNMKSCLKWETGGELQFFR